MVSFSLRESLYILINFLNNISKKDRSQRIFIRPVRSQLIWIMNRLVEEPLKKPEVGIVGQLQKRIIQY